MNRSIAIGIVIFTLLIVILGVLAGIMSFIAWNSIFFVSYLDSFSFIVRIALVLAVVIGLNSYFLERNK